MSGRQCAGESWSVRQAAALRHRKHAVAGGHCHALCTNCCGERAVIPSFNLQASMPPNQLVGAPVRPTPWCPIVPEPHGNPTKLQRERVLERILSQPNLQYRCMGAGQPYRARPRQAVRGSGLVAMCRLCTKTGKALALGSHWGRCTWQLAAACAHAVWGEAQLPHSSCRSSPSPSSTQSVERGACRRSDDVAISESMRELIAYASGQVAHPLRVPLIAIRLRHVMCFYCVRLQSAGVCAVATLSPQRLGAVSIPWRNPLEETGPAPAACRSMMRCAWPRPGAACCTRRAGSATSRSQVHAVPAALAPVCAVLQHLRNPSTVYASLLSCRGLHGAHTLATAAAAHQHCATLGHLFKLL